VKRYYITDRRSLGGADALLECVRRNVALGVDLIQVREKDLAARALVDLVRSVVALAAGTGTRILVNERLDVALAASAHGVHLPSDSPPVECLRQVAPAGFLIGKSTHTVAEVVVAERTGADFAVFGPVFEPLSKSSALPSRGLAGLAEACRYAIPVYALGGLTHDNAEACIAAGAAGIAGITLFQGSSQS
jgi:thiamine-phosphate pyrophosphorylase